MGGEVKQPATCESCPAWAEVFDARSDGRVGSCRMSGALTRPEWWCLSHPAIAMTRAAVVSPVSPLKSGSGFKHAESAQRPPGVDASQVGVYVIRPETLIDPPAMPNPRQPLDHEALPGERTPDYWRQVEQVGVLALDLERQRRITADVRKERDSALRLVQILSDALRAVSRITVSTDPHHRHAHSFCPWCSAEGGSACATYCLRRQALDTIDHYGPLEGAPPSPRPHPLAGAPNLIGRAEGDPILPCAVSVFSSCGETTFSAQKTRILGNELEGGERGPVLERKEGVESHFSLPKTRPRRKLVTRGSW